MTDSQFATLETAIRDDHFPDMDLALRRGRHIGRDDGTVYDFLVDAVDHLEPFYRRYGCELVQRSDGYFYLLPSSPALGRRLLSAGEMLVGQTLALLYLDPSTLQHGGVVTVEVLLQRLEGLLGVDALVRTLNPRRKRRIERVDAEGVRTQVGDALRKLEKLGFVELVESDRVKLQAALLRFAEPVRGLPDVTAALESLVERGEVVLAESTNDDDGEGDAESGADDEEDPADDDEEERS